MNSTRIALLLRYIEEDPDDPFSKYALALEYVRSGDDAAAQLLMEKVAFNHPQYLPNYYHFGKLLERTADNSRAREIYTRGMEVAKFQKDFHTLSELGSALDAMDDGI